MLKYRGGKSREIPNILPHIPRFEGRYVEPFFGGGALFFHLEPAHALINDINAKLVDFYAGVRNDFEVLREELDRMERVYTANRVIFEQRKALDPDARAEDPNEALYYHMRAMFNDLEEKEFSDAALYYFINKTAYSGMIRYNSRGEFNVPFGRYRNLNTDCVTEAHSRLLNEAELLNGDYADVFDLCEPDDFVFLDPPYDCTFSDYGNDEYRDGFNEENHRRLAQDFMNLPCRALMVIGHTPLTNELYNGYIAGEYHKAYAVNIRNRFRSAANHILVANYPLEGIVPQQPQAVARRRFEVAARPPRQYVLFEPDAPYGHD